VVLFAFFHSFLSESLCDKYSKALKISNKALVTKVVGETVKKLVAPKTPTLKFFDGSFPAGSVNFTNPANSARLTALSEALVAFFGGALGCTDGTIPAYRGANMTVVHKNMKIDDNTFMFFNNQVIQVLQDNGVSMPDRVAVRKVLMSLRNQIVTKQTSICDKYSQIKKVQNKDLVTSVVSGTFERITGAATPTLVFFNGVKPKGSTNFLNATNANKLNNLVTNLVTFFGAALGCTDGSIGAYMGGTLLDVHKNMQVDTNSFNFFNQQLVGVLRAASVGKADLLAVEKLLNSTSSQIVTK